MNKLYLKFDSFINSEGPEWIIMFLFGCAVGYSLRGVLGCF